MKQQVKSRGDAHAPDMKHTGEKLKATDAAHGALSSDVFTTPVKHGGGAAGAEREYSPASGASMGDCANQDKGPMIRADGGDHQAGTLVGNGAPTVHGLPLATSV